MAHEFETGQEAFWAGDFGTQYIERNKGDRLLASNLHFFSRALAQVHQPRSCIEFGANIGMNLRALSLLYPSQEQFGIEINADAASELRRHVGDANVHEGSILQFDSERTWDLVLIKGVMIHLDPSVLERVYDSLVRACGRYLLIAEYYNPTPVAIPYRGHEDRLFKRDFAGDVLDRHSEMRLVDYGFSYRRDADFPQDDITWFLLERSH